MRFWYFSRVTGWPHLFPPGTNHILMIWVMIWVLVQWIIVQD